jgi:hypothetical protein
MTKDTDANKIAQEEGPAALRRRLAETRPEPTRLYRFPLVEFFDVKFAALTQDLVRNLLPLIGLVVIYGPPKSGKSFWLLDLFLHIALGWQYRGRRVFQGSVIYIAGEGAEGVRRRIEAFRRWHRLEGKRVPFFLLTVPPDLINDVDALIQQIAEQLAIAGFDRPVAIAVDTLNRTLVGSESRDEDMGAYIKALGKIIETFKCAVCVVHHTGKDERVGPRGHNSLSAAADIQIKVSRSDGGIISAKVELAKDSAEGEQVASLLQPLDLGTDEYGDAISSCVVIQVSADELRASKTGDTPHLAKAALIALRSLQELIAERGEPMLQFDEHVPNDAKCVTIDAWRERA